MTVVAFRARRTKRGQDVQIPRPTVERMRELLGAEAEGKSDAWVAEVLEGMEQWARWVIDAAPTLAGS